MRDWWTVFHFIQPKWLWLLLAVPLIYLSFYIRQDVRGRWKRYIDPELLDHLIVSPKRRWRVRPIHMACVLIALGSIALAGPTWTREQPPFTEDKAPLVIALDLSRTMDAIDLDPTRIEHAKLKLRDLLKVRNGGRTALFVYAGTKAAQLNWALSLARQFGGQGVTVNILAPGAILTARNRDQMEPLGGTPEQNGGCRATQPTPPRHR